MANFATHLGWGAVGAGLLASTAYVINIVPESSDIMTLTIAGTIGSVLPDIDLEKAVPSRMLFTGLGLGLAFIVLFNLRVTYSIAELWLIWLGVFLLFRFGAYHVFHRAAKHRGAFHSLLAAAFFMVATAAILSHGLHHTSVVAWMGGAFVFLGYVIHLVLDELYAVDFAGGHLKKSFGSALKLYEAKSVIMSVFLLAATLVLIYVAPSPARFLEIIQPAQISRAFSERMLPRDGWFKSAPKWRSALPDRTGAAR